jgi:hypothetical protein
MFHPTKEEALTAFFGTTNVGLFSLQVPAAEHISRVAFRGRISTEELWQRHSLVNVLSVGHDDNFRQSLRTEILLVEDAERYKWPLRSCPHCVEEDMRRHGFAYWRLSHQWSQISICLEHGVRLDSAWECGCYNYPLWWNQRPEDACGKCGHRTERKRPSSPHISPIDREHHATFMDANHSPQKFSFWELERLRRWTNAAARFFRRGSRAHIERRLLPDCTWRGDGASFDDQEVPRQHLCADDRLFAFTFHRYWHKLIFEESVVQEMQSAAYRQLAQAFHAGESVPPEQRWDLWSSEPTCIR